MRDLIFEGSGKELIYYTYRTAVYETRTYGGVRGAPHRLQAVRPSTRLWVVLLDIYDQF